MNAKRYLLLTALVSLMLPAFSQDNTNAFELKIVKGLRSDMGLSYNFFTGPDNDDFTTTIHGFGSGFLLDGSGRVSKDIVQLGTNKANLTIGLGASLMKYRFSENIVFGNENDEFSYFIDNDPDHDYGSGFFSYGKSKLVTLNFFTPVSLNFHLGDFMISGTGLAEFYLNGKHKRKFKNEGERVKTVIRNDEFNDFPINKTKLGVGALFLHKPTGVNLGFTYMVTPFFKENQGPEINEMRISVSYEISMDNM